MPRPKIDYGIYVKRIPTHTSPLPPESAFPISHYVRSASDSWNLLLYIERNIDEQKVYGVALARHRQTLSVMVLLSLVEAFERFMKELAALCINEVGNLILDDRLEVFRPDGSRIASHFGVSTLGKCLCESLTWCDCEQCNDRFRRTLANPHDKNKGDFYVFPKTPGQHPATLGGKYDLMEIIWQLRHAIVHNRGILTASDARKLRVMCRLAVVGPAKLDPKKSDVWYVKNFLDETAEKINEEVASRLANLLSRLHADDPGLFDAAEKAQQLADAFQRAVTIGGVARNPK